MTDGTAGWFRDPNDPALARWHDGERWTEHTLVIADQAPGSEPAPPVTAEPTAPVATVFETAPVYGAAGGGSGGGAAKGGLPGWAKVLAPVVVVAVLGIAFLLSQGGDDSGNGKTQTDGTEVGTLQDAVAAARRAGLPSAVSDARAGAFIEKICDAADDGSSVDDLGQDLGNLPASTTSELRQDISALGAGAERRCADAMDADPSLIGDLQDAAAVAFATTTTAVTLLPDGGSSTSVVPGTDAGVDGGTGTGTGTGGKTTTTRKGTSTTKAPTTTTTKALPQALPNQPCSPEGASGKNKITGAGMTCLKSCGGGTKLTWRQSPCATNPTTPTTAPGSPQPTQPTVTSTTAP
jgi:hypothetical protein